MKVDVPLGDVVDRVTILRIKLDKLTDVAQVANVRHELRVLISAWHDEQLKELDTLDEWPGLCAINRELWEVEDQLRDHERRGDFGPAFVELARSVYKLNDRRAALKRSINLSLGSSVVEEKSYAPYDSPHGTPQDGQ